MEADWEKERKEFGQEVVPVLSSEDRNGEGAAVSGKGVETGAIGTIGGRAGQVMDRTGDQQVRKEDRRVWAGSTRVTRDRQRDWMQIHLAEDASELLGGLNTRLV